MNKKTKTDFLSMGFFLWFIIGFVICFKVLTPFANDKTLAFLITLVLYAFSIAVAISPIGEQIFRWITRVRPLANKRERDRLLPLWDEVYARAREQRPNLTENIQFFITDDVAPNAFAVGRKTVCVTSGLMNTCTDEEIKGILGHEAAHIANGDTMGLLIATVGNAVLGLVFLLARILIWIMSTLADNFLPGTGNILKGIANMLNILIAFSLFMGFLAAMKTSRVREFEADRFSAQLGYGEHLISALDKLEHMGGGSNKLGVLEAMKRTHPPTPVRIGEIENEMETMYADEVALE